MTDSPAEEPLLANEAELERRPIRALDLPGLIGGVLADIRTIAEGMAVLPKLLGVLGSVDARLEDIDNEVRQMRARVNKMEGNVGGMRDSIDRLEPHLEDVTRVAHPLRRLGERARRRDTESTEPASTEPESSEPES